MRNYWVWLTVVLTIVLIGAAYATVFKEGVTVLDAYANLTESHVVAIGRVESVENTEFIVHEKFKRVFAVLNIGVREVLYGTVPDSLSIVGVNTFFVENGEWLASYVHGMPWPIPGDNILFIAQRAEMNNKSMGCGIYYMLRTAQFLDDQESSLESILLDIVPVRPFMDGAKSADEEDFQSLLDSLNREIKDSGYTVSDIRDAIQTREGR